MVDKKEALIRTVGNVINASDGESFSEIYRHYHSEQYLQQAIARMEGETAVDPWQHLHLMIAVYTCAINGHFNGRVNMEVLLNWNSINEYNDAYWKIERKIETAILVKATRKSARA